MNKRLLIYFPRLLKSIFIVGILFFTVNPAVKAQKFANEWINYNQQYFKIPTTKKGIYRITRTDLATAGFPVGSVDPRRIQLFHRGQEQAIFINGEADAVFHPTDYIEFYGEGNDGTQDSLLYYPHSAQPHKYYNLYSDTTAYFLSWRLDNGFGKRMESFYEANINNISAETFHWDEKLLIFANQYTLGQEYMVDDVTLSYYDYGEGWTDTAIAKFQTKHYNLSAIEKMANTNAKPKLEVLLVGRNNKNHNTELFVGGTRNTLRSLPNVIPPQYQKSVLYSSTIEPSDFSGGRLVVGARSNGFSNNNADIVSVSYIRLLYPQLLDANGSPEKYFLLDKKVSNKSYIEITNPAANSILYDITDKNTVKRISTNLENGKLTAIVPGTASERKLLANSSFIASPPLSKIQFRNINPTGANYLIVSHTSLMKPAGDFPDAVRAYASYRASPAGGQYDTLVVDMDLLVNQFNYGEFSPLAIRRFADFMLKNGKPEYLFLIGRSLYPYDVRKEPNREHREYKVRDVVPTGGYPGSDLVLTSGLDGNPFVPSIPTGRINASTPQHIIHYLNKVKGHEATPPNALWRKNLVHLSGGKTQGELFTFKTFMDIFKKTAEGEYLGGKVATLSKKTDNAVELINIADQVNKGLLQITFFGHSSEDVSDIDIGFASDKNQGYLNKGKYPMILVNGCEAGNIFSGRNSFGQDWILTPDKGAILFLAHSKTGYPFALRSFTDLYYQTAFGDSIFVSKSIGKVHQEQLRRFTRNKVNPDYYFDIAHGQQMNLQGDPAIHMLPAAKPDYFTAGDQLFIKSFDNSSITAATDSFQVGIIVSNFGRVDRKNFPVTIRRTTGDGIIEQLDTLLYSPVFYKDTLYFTVKTKHLNSGGNNKFEIILDPANTVAELNENNNIGVLDYFLPPVGAVPLFPKEYSIVNKQPVHFIAQATSIGTENRQYIFELDTTHTFTSPAKQSTVVTASSLPSWKTNLLSTAASHDSTVYYWRIRFADAPGDVTNPWTESSFIYITNSTQGWSQSDFAQFSKSSNNQIERNTQKEKWEFKKTVTKINITVSGANHVEKAKYPTLSINNAPNVIREHCKNNPVIAVTFNRTTTRPYDLMPNLRCPFDPFVASYLNDSYVQSGGLEAYINAVPTGDYALVIALGTTTWTAAMKQKLTEIGADLTKLNQLEAGYSYVIIGKKGSVPGSAQELIGGPDQVLNFQAMLEGYADRGTVTSSVIGPASEWGSLFRNILNSEIDSQDKWQLDVIGKSLQGEETVVLADVTNDAYLLNSIDANQYPYLRLQLNVKDTVNLTPPQLKRWQVIYQGVPEGLINTGLVNKDLYKIADKYEGEEFVVPFVFQNISTRNFPDSLEVLYTITNTDTRQKIEKTFRLKPLAADDTVKFSVRVQTMGITGNNVLQVYVNPRIQPEQNYANNIHEIPFKVLKDNLHPVLDVAFDGMRIMNGDIVSPSPLITVSLKDDNKVLIRKDTTGMEVFLKKPCQGCTFERINLNQNDVRWTAAKAETNDFRLEYHPKNLPDGIYALRVQGSDLSGNKSGVEPYQINFEVINESKITHFYPYPNPFSSNTRFVFTLTGSEIPDQIKIQIMTVSGKVIREITQEELGPIRIGNNISSFTWNGTDEFGDKLANGVYLYRVIIKNKGQVMDRRQTAADKAFHKDFGKIYILR